MKTCGGAEVQLHHSWPRHQMEVGGRLHAPVDLPPGKSPRPPPVIRLGAPPPPRARLEAVEMTKIPVRARNWTPAVKQVARRHTDRAVPAHKVSNVRNVITLAQLILWKLSGEVQEEGRTHMTSWKRCGKPWGKLNSTLPTHWPRVS
jgi:hypothetical protein